MIVHVDLTGDIPAVTLREPLDCKAFHLEASGDQVGLGPALEATGVGRLLPSGDAMIDVVAIRRLAGGRMPASWEPDFKAMLQYAESKGWLDEGRRAVRAHVEQTPQSRMST